MARERPAGRNAWRGKFRRTGGDDDIINCVDADTNVGADVTAAKYHPYRKYSGSYLPVVWLRYGYINERYNIKYAIDNDDFDG